MTGHVEYRQAGTTAVITLSRPEACNAISLAMAEEIGPAVAAAERDPSVRVGVLTGVGRYFCAGGDLTEQVPVTPGPGGFAGFVTAERRKPWIAAVNGPAIGGGTELALACSLVVAADTASFYLPEVTRGSVAYGGGAIRLIHRVPRNVALEMLLTGMPLPAGRALELGLVNRVASAADVLSEAVELADGIGQHPPLAVTEALRLAELAQGLPEDQLWRENQASREMLFASPEFAEGRAAFSEKRAPSWKRSVKR